MNSTLAVPTRFSNLLMKYFLWVFWNTLGFTLALLTNVLSLLVWSLIISLVMAWLPSSPVVDAAPMLLSIFQIILISLIIASCQGFALGVRKIHIQTWILTNTLTWAIFLALAVNLPPKLFSSNMWAGTILVGITMGLLIGIPQGFLMQRAGCKSWWWILASILASVGGFATAVSVAMSILRILGDLGEGTVIFSIVPLFGFVSSLISGLFLLRPIRWFDT